MSDSTLLIRGTGGIGDYAGPSAVLIEDGRIGALDADAEARARSAGRVLEADGLAVAPGFVELQVNGAAGRDFTHDPAAMWDPAVGTTLARHGVTAFLPTIVSGPPEVARDAIAAYGNGAPEPAVGGALPIGLHLEGPFLSEARRGAHDPAYLRDPDATTVDEWIDAGGVRIVTIAPERAGAMDAIGRLSAAGVIASIGHTDADATTARRAIDAGARMATHVFNAMSPLGHRTPGAVAALLDDERVTLGVIADDVHLDPLILRLIRRVAAGRVALVSDAIASLGRPDGTHRLGGREVTVREGAARLADGTLAGSAAGLDAGVRHYASVSSPRAAIEAATAVPARILRSADGRGTLEVGGRADVVLLDERLEVRLTLVGGAIGYETEDLRWD